MTVQITSATLQKNAGSSVNVAAKRLGIKTADVVKIAHRLKQGLPFAALERLQRHSGLSMESLGTVTQIPRRTLARRRAQGKLTSQESERLYRLACVFENAVELFEGDIAQAHDWLNTPNKALSGHSPLTMAETEIGAREVEDLIGRLEHGVFA